MIFGWDVSTSIIGVTLLKDDGSFVCSDHLDLRKSEDGMLSKAEEVEEWVRELLECHASNFVVDRIAQANPVFDAPVIFDHFIEDRLGSFAAGRTMLQVLMKLAAFNMVVSYIIQKASTDLVAKNVGGGGVRIEHIHPSTVKSIMRKEGLVVPKGGDKKVLTLDFVSRRWPGFTVDRNRKGNPQPWCFDRADSLIVARAGYLRSYLSRNGTGEEATGDQVDARA